MEYFGALPSGEPVHRLHLAGGGLTAKLLTYGAVLQDLRIEGHAVPLVLGFPTFAPYLTHSPHFGATAGRCANRIRDGEAELDGRLVRLDRNFLGKHHLHGGSDGMGKRLWQLEDSSPSALTLTISLPDGHMGYPGELTARAAISLLSEGVLDIQLTATTDRETLCNLAHHSYFRLDNSGSIDEHWLQLDAEAYLPVDDELIPTGEIRSVRGTPFDFRQPALLGERVIEQSIDHNFCVAKERGKLRRVASLRSLSSGLEIEVRTTEPGLQVYDGARLDIDIAGLAGENIGPRAGIALEPQTWPDASHNPSFPQAVLRPGETYSQHTQYAFSMDQL